MGGPDWAKIRKEYIKGGTSYRKLAEKYHVSRTAIEHKARDGKWQEAKSQTQARTVAKTVEAISDQEAAVDARLYGAAMLLLGCLEQSVTALAGEGGLDPDAMRGYSSSLRSIQQVLSSRPTQRDIEEQMARIAKLRKEAEEDERGGDSVQISFEGDISKWAE